MNTLDAMVGKPQRALRAVRDRVGARRRRRELARRAARGGADRAVGGHRAWRAWRDGAAAHPSPNAGVIEAAFAGALGLRLGGTLAYAGRVEHRPLLGTGARARRPRDVARARSALARASRSRPRSLADGGRR